MKSALVATKLLTSSKRRCRNDGESGSILILTALSMAVLLGIAALSIDVSFMYDKRNILHAAADAGAKSAAIEVHLSADPSSVPIANLQAFANQQVSTFGLTPAACGTAIDGVSSVCVYHPPNPSLSGVPSPFAGNVNYVEVIVSEQRPTFFAKVLGWANVTPRARAVAGTSASPICMITLQPGPASLSIGSSSNLTMGCGIAVGGDLVVDSSGYINGSSTGVTGTCSGTGGGCTHVTNMTLQAPPPTDPLAGLQAPADPGCVTPGCTVVLPGGGTPSTLSPGRYSTSMRRRPARTSRYCLGCTTSRVR